MYHTRMVQLSTYVLSVADWTAVSLGRRILSDFHVVILRVEDQNSQPLRQHESIRLASY